MCFKQLQFNWIYKHFPLHFKQSFVKSFNIFQMRLGTGYRECDKSSSQNQEYSRGRNVLVVHWAERPRQCVVCTLEAADLWSQLLLPTIITSTISIITIAITTIITIIITITTTISYLALAALRLTSLLTLRLLEYKTEGMFQLSCYTHTHKLFIKYKLTWCNIKYNLQGFNLLSVLVYLWSMYIFTYVDFIIINSFRNNFLL